MNTNFSLKSLSVSFALALSACGSGDAISVQIDDQNKGAVKSANSANWILAEVNSIQISGLTYLKSITTALSGTNTTTTDLADLCSSGSYLTSWRAGDTQHLMVNDTITLTLTNCKKSDGYTYNGTETHTITSFPSAGTGTSNADMTIKSEIDNLKVTTPGTSPLSPLSTVSFSGSDNLLFTRNRTFDNISSSYYPVKYKTSGSLTSTLSTTASTLASGTYTISNGVASKTYSNSNDFELFTQLTSSDGTYNNVVLTNVQPEVDNSTTTLTYPIYSISYAGAKVTSTTSNLDTTLTGTNSNGLVFTPFVLSGQKYFYISPSRSSNTTPAAPL